MGSEQGDVEDAANRLRETLLSYLLAATTSPWPGVDGMTVEDVVGCYPEAVAAGTVPDWQELLLRHPEMDAALHAWLAAKDRWEFAVRRAVGARSLRREGRKTEK